MQAPCRQYHFLAGCCSDALSMAHLGSQALKLVQGLDLVMFLSTAPMQLAAAPGGELLRWRPYPCHGTLVGSIDQHGRWAVGARGWARLGRVSAACGIPLSLHRLPGAWSRVLAAHSGRPCRAA